MGKVVALAAASLICWVVMFLAGTDVWHFAGSPDFWRLPGPPYADMRAAAYAFYAQLVVLVVMLVACACSVMRRRASGR